MPQSLSRIWIHLVFSTKNREPFLTPQIRAEVHSYLATILQNHGCPAMEVGGVADHVHALFGMARTRSIATVVEHLKTTSSRWLKTKGGDLRNFFWQAGYGAFSVSESDAGRVATYIRNQERHHEKMTFQDEYRRFLTKHRIAFDESHIWD